MVSYCHLRARLLKLSWVRGWGTSGIFYLDFISHLSSWKEECNNYFRAQSRRRTPKNCFHTQNSTDHFSCLPFCISKVSRGDGGSRWWCCTPGNARLTTLCGASGCPCAVQEAPTASGAARGECCQDVQGKMWERKPRLGLSELGGKAREKILSVTLWRGKRSLW